MKSILTKVIALMCVTLLVLSLAACGEKGTKGNESETTASAVETTENSASSAADKETVAETEADKSASSAAESSAANIDPELVGKWGYESGGNAYRFEEDGTGGEYSGSVVMDFTYEASDGVLSILYMNSTNPVEFEYEIDGDTLNIKDSAGSDTSYVRK